jgi:hypothetical protein
MTDLQPDQRQLGTSNHLSFNKVMDAAHILEFTHEFRKIVGLRVPRKHGIIYHAQGASAEVKKIPNTGGSILESHNSASTILIRPEIDVIRLSKSMKDFNPRVYPLIFGSSI